MPIVGRHLAQYFFEDSKLFSTKMHLHFPVLQKITNRVRRRMKGKPPATATVVLRKDSGWVVERGVGKYTIVFHHQYRSAAEAMEAALALFPGEPVEVLSPGSARKRPRSTTKMRSARRFA